MPKSFGEELDDREYEDRELEEAGQSDRVLRFGETDRWLTEDDVLGPHARSRHSRR